MGARLYLQFMHRQWRAIQFTEGYPLVPALCNACWSSRRRCCYVSRSTPYMLSDKVGDGAHDTYEECCSFLNFPRVSNKSYNIFFTYGILMLPLICYWRLWFESGMEVLFGTSTLLLRYLTYSWLSLSALMIILTSG